MLLSYFKKIQHYWHYSKIDTQLFCLIIILSCFGFTILNSASESQNTLYKQLFHFALAFSAMLVIAQIPPYQIKRYSTYLMFFGMALLIITLLFGIKSSGAQRWLDLGFIRFQPSELMKIIIPIAVASILSKKTLPPQPKTIMLSLFYIIFSFFLITQQPDLGTAIQIALSGFYALFLSGIKIKIVKNNWLNVTLIISFIISVSYIAWNYLLIGYQKQRVLTFIKPQLDNLSSGYHIEQSKIAIGSGGLLGKGWGEGSQSQLDFLPEHTTDFIFAVIAEELGFVGVIILFIMYGLIIYRCLLISSKAKDNFSKLLGTVLTLTFFNYVFVNIAMVSGILPVVGTPLPLISYGGSSLLTLMASFGIIMSINKHKAFNYNNIKL